MDATVRGARYRGWYLAWALVIASIGCVWAREVPFRLHAPQARRVFVCGSFTHWRCVALHRTRHGVFRGRLAVAPGLYEYGFRVDGHWRLGRHAPRVRDGLGGYDDLLVVGR